ncbi:hypothetical protein DBA20_00900 [Pandoraea capi]|nr:hypothetical protein [Pandoraea sp. LA3]MDN4581543.1 hypothetical protein [Pandoraea capi]
MADGESYEAFLMSLERHLHEQHPQPFFPSRSILGIEKIYSQILGPRIKELPEELRLTALEKIISFAPVGSEAKAGEGARIIGGLWKEIKDAFRECERSSIAALLKAWNVDCRSP